MRFFKGTAAERASSSKTGESGDLVIESDTGKVAVADGTNTLGDLQLLARANEVTAAQAAAAADATTKANAAQSAATTAAATDATAKAAAARAGAVTDVTTDITGGTGPVATALTASTADAISGTPDSGLTPQEATDERVGERALYKTYVARNAIDAGVDSTGATDQSAEITAFLNDALANQREAHFPRGDYMAEQIVVPSKLSLGGAGVGGFGINAANAGTRFHQAPGADKPFMVFTGTSDGAGRIEIGPVQIHDIMFMGDPANNTSGHAIAFQDADGVTLGKVQDTTVISRCMFRYWPQSGIYVPQGARPLTVDLCDFLWNGEYGIDFQQQLVVSQFTQAVHFRDISGDGNALGLVRCKKIGRDGSITFTSVKSEKRVNPLDALAGKQEDCLIFEDCDDTAVTINGLTHVSSVPSGLVHEPPGAAIVVKGTGKPQIEYSGVTVRVRSDDVAGSPAVLRDDALTRGDGVTKFSLPATATTGRRSGIYGGTSGDYLWAEEARFGHEMMLTSGETTISRTDGGISTGNTMTSGTLRGLMFTARKTEVISSVDIMTGNTAAGATPTLIRVGVYEEQSDGSCTLIASSANDTTKLVGASGTSNVFTLSTPFTKIRGVRYGVALLVVTAATAPQVYASTGLTATLMGLAPHVAFGITGQTDLPSTISNSLMTSGASSTRIFARLIV